MAAGAFTEYLGGLRDDRRPIVVSVIEAIRAGIDPAFSEAIQYGMPSWVVAHDRYPGGYHCAPAEPVPFMHVASRAKQVVVYSMAMYGVRDVLDWFDEEYAELGIGKLKRGKSCLNFTKLDAIPLALLTELAGKVTLEQYVTHYRTVDPR